MRESSEEASFPNSTQMADSREQPGDGCEKARSSFMESVPVFSARSLGFVACVFLKEKSNRNLFIPNNGYLEVSI